MKKKKFLRLSPEKIAKKSARKQRRWIKHNWKVHSKRLDEIILGRMTLPALSKGKLEAIQELFWGATSTGRLLKAIRKWRKKRKKGGK